MLQLATGNRFRGLYKRSGIVSPALDKVMEPQRTMSPEILAMQDSILQIQETISGRKNVPEE